jgi:hypothetical protein
MLSAIAIFSVVLAAGAPALLDLAATADGIAIALGSVTPSLGTALRRGRGRPRKFAGPSRAITLTLPEAVLETLGKIHPDPSRAVAQLATRRGSKNGRPAAELSVFGERAIITVRPTPTLEHRAGIELVPLPDGRALMSFDQPRTIAELELFLYDALEDPKLSDKDREVFEAIGGILKEARRSSDVTLLRRSIIVLESARRPRSAAKRAGATSRR